MSNASKDTIVSEPTRRAMKKQGAGETKLLSVLTFPFAETELSCF
jgi:hypothetical protein